ncbi:tyrosine-type recombinase/integrase [Streptomyces hesseae]|uniref:Tyrosine-type recombinase/integrase n=1 Tax=Streptomyces hesseae TaxID=3075519 RepID=A0ABU2SMC9_9ACTN|nr:tyrosine-type recombinase/integrase [Streptomyces sp. DSM 40473]MDT0449210.1 tyrosine-type recombinase/integrase [Streptomyces sp. DSM 40473]
MVDSAGGFLADPNQTVADYLTAWLQAKAMTLKPTTVVRYHAYVVDDLVPALGKIKLDDLGYGHIAAFVRAQFACGRGPVTVHRILATLSSALGEAVRHHRLDHNPARPTIIPRPAAAERHIWTLEETAVFLRYCHTADPLMADLVEILIGTGIRKGEALALRWDDVHLDKRVLYIHTTLSAIDNNRLVITTPKTRSSRSWVAISDRVATALQRRRRARCPSTAEGLEGDFVFHRPDGRPIHPEYALNRFHLLSREADVSRTTIHDLRHLSATISINAGVPLTVVSKTLRHSTLSTTANIYSHLTTQAAREAVDAIDKTLTRADRPPTPPRPIPAPRPPCDHIPQLHNQMTITRQPTSTRNYGSPALKIPRTCDHLATTSRHNIRKAVLAPCENGLRPAKIAGRDGGI